MTIQPIEAVDILTGLEEHRRCEVGDHDDRPNKHADGGEQFGKVDSQCCSRPTIVLVICAKYITESTPILACSGCGTRASKDYFWTILGPANPATR